MSGQPLCFWLDWPSPGEMLAVLCVDTGEGTRAAWSGQEPRKTQKRDRTSESQGVSPARVPRRVPASPLPNSAEAGPSWTGGAENRDGDRHADRSALCPSRR